MDYNSRTTGNGRTNDETWAHGEPSHSTLGTLGTLDASNIAADAELDFAFETESLLGGVGGAGAEAEPAWLAPAPAPSGRHALGPPAFSEKEVARLHAAQASRHPANVARARAALRHAEHTCTETNPKRPGI